MTYSCPQCSEQLHESKSHLACPGCNTIYPILDGIPWLLPHPERQLVEWRLKLQALLGYLETEAESYKTALKKTDLGALTQKRLRKVLQAKVEHKKYLTELLGPLTRQTDLPPEILKATGIQIPSGQSLTSYYTNVHRDWAWDTSENDACIAVIKHLLGSSAHLGRVLVLGAGACRLPYDIYQTYQPESLVASDINPFMLLVAKRILKGKSVKLYEFPIAPKDLESYAVLRKCVAPRPVEDNFQIVFADAFRPPFAPGTFDTIFTPWLIDILPYDMTLIVQSVNRLLKKGGVWINFGSHAFNHSSQALNYSLEESLELIQAHGFLLADMHKDRIPYMQSPASLHSRLETVVSFAATKQKDTDTPQVPAYLPEWLRDLSQSVPNLQAFQAARVVHGIYTDVLSLLDQKRSIQDIAKIFGEQHRLEPKEAEVSLQGFFTKLWEESLAAKNF